MPTLLLDCAFHGLTLGLAQGGNLTDHFSTAQRHTGGAMHPFLEDMLVRNGQKLSDIQKLVVTVGPGSFTGIRLGLAVAEAMKLTNKGLEVVGLSTLQCAATQFCTAQNIPRSLTVWLDAAGGHVYSQTFGPDTTPLTQAACLPQTQAEEALPAGTTLVTANTILADAAHTFSHLEASAMLQTAQNPSFHLPAEPHYLKDLHYHVAG